MTPRYSVLIPTLNEAGNIEQALSAAQDAFGGEAEYIVCDGGSTDQTTDIARQAGVCVMTAARGRGHQLDAALRAASGQVCVLLHADTLLPADAGAYIDRALRHAIGGAFFLRFNEPGLEWLARAINRRTRVFRSATGDQAMFALRSVLLEIGGVPREDLFEDVRLWKKLKRAGRLQLVDAEVTTSARLWLKLGTWRVIWLHWGLRTLHTLGVPPRRLARLYPTAGS